MPNQRLPERTVSEFLGVILRAQVYDVPRVFETHVAERIKFLGQSAVPRSKFENYSTWYVDVFGHGSPRIEIETAPQGEKTVLALWTVYGKLKYRSPLSGLEADRDVTLRGSGIFTVENDRITGYESHTVDLSDQPVREVRF